MAELAGMAALVTGGAAGIGRAVVHRLAELGAAVSLIDVDERGGRSVVDEVRAKGGDCRLECLDLADQSARADAVPRAVEWAGHLDVVVNNAARLGRREPLDALSHGDWTDVLETNLAAAAFLSRDAAPHLRTSAVGNIVNVTSIQERLPLATHVAYAASKGGLSALTRALAVELGGAGVRVNAVAPGSIETPSMADTRRTLGLDDARPTTGPAMLGRPGDPAEVAEAVAFLASPRASFITGTVLTVDGGRSLSRRADQLAVGLEPGQDFDGSTDD